MSNCCLQGLVYAADDCRPLWAKVDHGATTTTFLEFDLTPYTGAVVASPEACDGGASFPDTTVITDNNDGTGTISNPDTGASLDVCLAPCASGGGADTTSIVVDNAAGTATISNPDTGQSATVCLAPCDGGPDTFVMITDTADGLDFEEADGSETHSITLTTPGNNGTVDITVGDKTERVLRTFKVNAGQWGASEEYDPDAADHIALLDRNVQNGGDGAGNPGAWPYPTAIADIEDDDCVTGVYKRGSDGLIVGPPEHDIFSEGEVFGMNPTGISFSVDNDGIGPHDIFRVDLGTCVAPADFCRAATLRVDYILTGAMGCIPDGSAVLWDAFIENMGPELGAGQQRVTATGSLNRSFDSCWNNGPVAEDLGGGQLVNIAGGIAPGTVIDLGEFVMDVEFIGFQSQTANPFQMLVNVFPALTVRCTWITEKI